MVAVAVELRVLGYAVNLKEAWGMGWGGAAQQKWRSSPRGRGPTPAKGLWASAKDTIYFI